MFWGIRIPNLGPLQSLVSLVEDGMCVQWPKLITVVLNAEIFEKSCIKMSSELENYIRFEISVKF